MLRVNIVRVEEHLQVRKRSGLYPAVEVDAAGSGVVSQAGGVLLLETVRASGLDSL